MNGYLQKAIDNLVPLSEIKKLPDAFQEWGFNGDTIDHAPDQVECQLCDKTELRYHFKIENMFNDNTMWIGSKCILKFDISVIDDGMVLDKEAASKKLDRCIDKMRGEACIKALEEVCKPTISHRSFPILMCALDYYKQRGYLSPKLAAVVFFHLRRNRIDNNPSFFKVNLKDKNHVDHLRDMDKHRVHLIWGALTSSQRKIAIREGHSAPPPFVHPLVMFSTPPPPMAPPPPPVAPHLRIVRG